MRYWSPLVVLLLMLVVVGCKPPKSVDTPTKDKVKVEKINKIDKSTPVSAGKAPHDEKSAATAIETIDKLGGRIKRDAKGNVVFVDFGEVILDTDFMASAAERRSWETKDALLKGFLPDEYHAYYFQAMRDRLSGDNFQRHWAADLDDLDRDIIRGPKLKNRREDIPGLVEQILERANREEGWERKGVVPDVMDLLCACRWGGSGVGLQNVLYRGAASCRGTIIQLDDMPP